MSLESLQWSHWIGWVEGLNLGRWLAIEMLYASLVFLIVWGISSVWRGAPAKVHYGLWSLVLLRLVLPVDLATPWSVGSWAGALVPEVTVAAAAVAGAADMADEPESLALSMLESSSARAEWRWLGGLWLLCGVALAIHLWCHRRSFAQLASVADPVEGGVALVLLERWRGNLRISRRVRLVTSAAPNAEPFTLGTWRPVVCVPRELLGRPHLLEACLAHELAHIRRFDDLRLLCGNALRVVYVLFPPVHWAVARLAWEQERLCDELAVSRGKLSRSRYLEAMLQLFQTRQSASGAQLAAVPSAVVPGLSFTKRNLKMRLESLLSRPAGGQTWLGRGLLCLLAVAVLPMAPFAEARTGEPPSQVPAAAAAARQASNPAFGQARPGLTNPLPGHRVTSGFGQRQDPFDGGKKHHTGIDIAVTASSRVVAAAAGVVESADANGDWGQMVVIDHGKGMKTVYAHLDRSLVAVGARVDQGQVIAVPGSSGKSTGPHLHFEVWNEGELVDPASEIADLR